jgi:hypothetical protein
VAAALSFAPFARLKDKENAIFQQKMWADFHSKLIELSAQ